jgi:hypothetical protein
VRPQQGRERSRQMRGREADRGIFADSLDSELASVSGDSAAGLAATFKVGIAA